jgi:hypothetical protein
MQMGSDRLGGLNSAHALTSKPEDQTTLFRELQDVWNFAVTLRKPWKGAQWHHNLFIRMWTPVVVANARNADHPVGGGQNQSLLLNLGGLCGRLADQVDTYHSSAILPCASI